MPEGQNFKIEKELFNTKPIVEIVGDSIKLNLGNSGFRLVYDGSLVGNDMNLPCWMMHFTPESRGIPVSEKRIIYSRMFAAGFISMIETLASRKVSFSTELEKILKEQPPEIVGFNTNDVMWDFACKIAGEKYFMKVVQSPDEHIPSEGHFILSDFLADYEVDPNLLNRCRKLVDIKKFENLKVKRPS